MEEKKFVGVRKDEYNLKLFVKRMFGKGKVSKVRIEYTPVGEKIIVSTHKPGWIIGKRGEKINELTEVLKRRFKMENPHVDIEEIMHPEFDAQLTADDIATFQLGTHPAVTASPIAYQLVNAAEMAIKDMR